MNVGKSIYLKGIFAISFVVYMINLFSILFFQKILFFHSSTGYNYLSIMFSGIFMYLFFTSLKKGALTIRYIITMFIILVLVPFFVALVSGKIII